MTAPTTTLVEPAPDPRVRLGALIALLVHAVVIWWLFADQPIGGSWREAETQAMAHNLVGDGFDLLHPRVDWRGASDGRVECEFPLYQAIVGALLAWRGDVEWPGRLLSLLSLLVTAGSLFALAERRCGSWPAAIGTAAFLSSAQAMLLGTRVMPDGLSTALALLGLVLFLRYLRSDRLGTLLLATAFTTLGALAKPTAAVIVLLQILALLSRPPRRQGRAWLAFAAMAAIGLAWVVHARSSGLATGLTYGVTFGDTKMPDWDHLLRPGLYLGLARTTAVYGLAWTGAAALLALLLRRRLDATDVTTLAVVGWGLVASLRYSHSADMGPHYHVFAALAGGWLVARAWPAAPKSWLTALAVIAVVGNGVVWAKRELSWRQTICAAADLAAAARLQQLSSPRELVVIRGPKPRVDPFWRRPHNFEEPVLLYHSRRKGWVLPVDGVDPDVLSSVRANGARWYVETAADMSLATELWLTEHAEEVPGPSRARIFRLLPP